jgi:hypothetical protein
LIEIATGIENDEKYADLMIQACAFYRLEFLLDTEKAILIAKIHNIIKQLYKG